METNTNLRIIVIDDNPSIHQDFIKILMSNKSQTDSEEKLAETEKLLFGDIAENISKTLPRFEIDTASQGKEGVEKIEEALKIGRPYALAFVDIRMPPGWDGIETIKHIWALDQGIQVVICTAYSDYSWEETIAELGERDNLLILKKPFDNISVRQLASALTKKWQLLQESRLYTSSLEERVKQRTDSLNQSLSLMRATLESSADGVLVIDDNGKIKDFNQKFLDMWQIPTTLLANKNDDVNFKSMIDFILGLIKNKNGFRKHLKEITKNPEAVLIDKIKFNDKRIFEYYTQPYTLNSKNIGRVWSFRDITERASLEQELQFQATHDQLTGLPNRVLLHDRIKQAMARADRNHTIFGVLFLDLDRFKLINDSLSHEAGDKVLCEVSKRLEKVVRHEDTLVRLGGDEFVIMVTGIDSENHLIDFCRRVLAVFDEKFSIYEHELTLSTSIGVSIYPLNGTTIDILLRDADVAMYHAKELGQNQFQFYTEELNRKNMERLELESELRQAITRNEFVLFYQPQFDLKTNQFVSVEALIRWMHPKKGMVLPINFIPTAEESGLIVPIGEWVLRTACKQMKAWTNAGLPPIRVGVNITTKQFRLYNLVEIIGDILKEVGLEPKYLELELTENMIINNIDIIQTIHDLKAMGVQIALDDFGTGYSSLNYLREIAVDRLKIDQSYVQNIDSKRGDDVIIQAIITMAKSLNLEVIAEGVETQKQVDFLKERKCNDVQGFYFSRPISASDCETLLRSPKATNLFE